MSTLPLPRYAAAYIRVSTDDQAELSPDSQLEEIRKYAQRENLLLLQDHIYIDAGISGKKADRRPEFMRMIAQAKEANCPFSVILLWKYSRFARNQEESIFYKSVLRSKCGIDVVSVTEPLIAGPFGSLIERIIEWMDEYYVIRLSGDVTRGMTENAQRGNYQARPPLGYRIEHKGEPPVIVPEEAEIVRLIFHKYVNERLSLLEICRQLNAMELKTSRNKDFEKRSLVYILQNISYTGKVRWNRTENETNRIKPQEEWIITEGKHPAIITEEMFDAAQKRFQTEHVAKHRKPATSVTHWLGGVLKCSNCGRTLSTSRQVDKKYGKTYYHFQCYGYLKGKCSVSHCISEKKVVPYVLNALKDAMDSQEVEFEIRKGAKPEHKSELKLIETAMEKLKEKERRIKKAYRDGIDTLEEYKENKELLLNEKHLLEEKLEAIQAEPDPDTDYRASMLNRISSVYDLLMDETASTVQKNEGIKSIVEKIVYNKQQGSLTIYFYLNESLDK